VVAILDSLSLANVHQTAESTHGPIYVCDSSLEDCGAWQKRSPPEGGNLAKCKIETPDQEKWSTADPSREPTVSTAKSKAWQVTTIKSAEVAPLRLLSLLFQLPSCVISPTLLQFNGSATTQQWILHIQRLSDVPKQIGEHLLSPVLIRKTQVPDPAKTDNISALLAGQRAQIPQTATRRTIKTRIKGANNQADSQYLGINQ